MMKIFILQSPLRQLLAIFGSLGLLAIISMQLSCDSKSTDNRRGEGDIVRPEGDESGELVDAEDESTGEASESGEESDSDGSDSDGASTEDAGTDQDVTDGIETDEIDTVDGDTVDTENKTVNEPVNDEDFVKDKKSVTDVFFPQGGRFMPIGSLQLDAFINKLDYPSHTGRWQNAKGYSLTGVWNYSAKMEQGLQVFNLNFQPGQCQIRVATLNFVFLGENAYVVTHDLLTLQGPELPLQTMQSGDWQIVMYVETDNLCQVIFDFHALSVLGSE